MAARRKTRRTAAQKAATRRMLAGARRARTAKGRRRRTSKKLHKYVGTTPHASTGRMYGPALPATYGYETVAGGMRSTRKKRKSSKKRAKKAAPKRRKARKSKAHKHSHAKKRTTKRAHKHVTAKSILKAAKGPKVWVCVGRVRTGCGGGKRGGHVVGNLRFA